MIFIRSRATIVDYSEHRALSGWADTAQYPCRAQGLLREGPPLRMTLN